MDYLNIGIGSESEGLYKLARFLEDNSNKFDLSLLYELQEIVEEVDADMCELEMVPAEVEEIKDAIEIDCDNLLEEVVNVFTHSDNINSIEKEVKQSINKYKETINNYSFEDSLFNNRGNEQEDINKMKALGYKFKEDRNIEIVEPVKVETIEESKQAEEPVKEKLVATITQLDENTYSIKNREIDAEYNAQTKKLSGKGARKHKAEMLELVNEFIENNKGQEVSTNKTSEYFKNISKWQESQIIVGHVIRGKFAIALLKGVDYQGKPVWKVQCVDIQTGELNEEMSDIIYLSSKAAIEFIESIEDVKPVEEKEVRDITPLTIDELFKNKPSLEESTAYFVKWYKDRENDYGDKWTDKKAMNDLGESFLNKFTALYKDRKKLAFIGAAEKELKEMFPSFNAFQYASTIHQKAKVFEKEWNEMIEDMEKSRTS
ncbi:hypothetical protein AAXE64_08315 [Priestia megaterium]